jgi:hypothetical protein
MPGPVMRVPATDVLGDPLERLAPTRARATRICGAGGFSDEHPDEILLREAIRVAIEAVPEAEALVDVSVASGVVDYGLVSRCIVDLRGTAVRQRSI